MSRKEDRAARPAIDVSALAAKFNALGSEQARYAFLTSFNFPVDNKLRDALHGYWPWTGPRAADGLTVTLNYAEWLQAAQIGSI